ncbi:MAG: P1 family peptidase [Desulfomonile tiedjei]|uniref:P1 family peptidase n=1 Tax=Desulfomonile tiedjei TaxID=2358 RepID=A0A9D6V4F3_9BACT|nr:P1 family peptidase [Desulfomonile tiedjei]
MTNIGKKNCLTDVEGIIVGNFTSLDATSGVTVVLCLEGAVAGVDVRGSAPGTRETDCLRPLNLVEKVQGVVLTGGSVYGLSTTDGVVRWLAEKGCGFPLGQGMVAPIVPAAALFDLGRGKDYVPPANQEWGVLACESATSQAVELGCTGAGTGAMAGSIKGGLGSASEILDSGITVAALMAVNALGSVINEATGLPWEISSELNGEFGPLGKRAARLPEKTRPQSPSNTTIGVIATDAVLTKAQAQKVAQMAQDGLARAIRPAHTMYDGDAIFCLSTGKVDLPQTDGFFVARGAEALNQIGRAAADCTSRAIIRAVIEARSLGTMIALRDLGPLWE